MSNEILNKVRYMQIGNSSAKFLLCVLADRADDNGVCYPSYKIIRGQTEFSDSTINRAIKKLENCGVLTKKLHNGRHNIYQITPDNFTGTVVNLVNKSIPDDAFKTEIPADFHKKIAEIKQITDKKQALTPVTLQVDPCHSASKTPVNLTGDDNCHLSLCKLTPVTVSIDPCHSDSININKHQKTSKENFLDFENPKNRANEIKKMLSAKSKF